MTIGSEMFFFSSDMNRKKKKKNADEKIPAREKRRRRKRAEERRKKFPSANVSLQRTTSNSRLFLSLLLVRVRVFFSLEHK